MNFRKAIIIAWLLLASFVTAQTASAAPTFTDTVIRTIFIDVDANALTINGLNFGMDVGVAAFARSDGRFSPLTMVVWTDTTITAELPPRPPGNYNVLVIKAGFQGNTLLPHDFGVMAVTIGAPATEVPDQSCPAGEVATGITGGILQCEEPPEKPFKTYVVSASVVFAPFSPNHQINLHCDTGDVALSASFADLSVVTVNNYRTSSRGSVVFKAINESSAVRNAFFFATCLDAAQPASAEYFVNATCVDFGIFKNCHP